MKKTIFAAIAITLISFTSQAKASEALTKKLEDYLNSITTISSEFVQTTNLSSEQLTGKFYLNRPGRLRFEYNEFKDFIVADSSLIHFYDSQMEQHSSTAIQNTPAYFFLKNDIRLSGDITPTEISETDDLIKLVIEKEDQGLSGSLAVFFSKSPLELSGWRIIDAAGTKTFIVLKDAKFGQKLDTDIFYFYPPNKEKSIINR